jgi:molecular chaperone GrpE
MSATEQSENQVDEAPRDVELLVDEPDLSAIGQAGASEPKAQAAESEALKRELAQVKSERQELNDRMLRIAADFENYRRRVRKDIEDATFRTTERLLREMLPVLDNLDRALDAAGGEQIAAAAGPLLEGVRMVQRQFLSALEKFDVKTFEAQGKAFDPQVHEAVQQVESDTLQPGTVATVFQRGYTAGGRLLRPALVAVVRGKPQAPAQDPQGGAEPDQAGDGLPN